MLLKTDSLSGGFEQFAAIEELPTHNQQVRMLAGANVKTQQRATRSMLELAKGRLCHIDCVGVLEEMDSLVRCVSKQLLGVLPTKKAKGLHLKKKNSIEKHKEQGGVTTTEKISKAARETVLRVSWADDELHAFAKGLVETRVD